MAGSEYTEVDSLYYPDGDNPDLILRADAPGDKEWMYSFYDDKDDIPLYMKQHSQRDQEASEIEETTKLSRMTDQHMTEEPEKEWRTLE